VTNTVVVRRPLVFVVPGVTLAVVVEVRAAVVEEGAGAAGAAHFRLVQA